MGNSGDAGNKRELRVERTMGKLFTLPSQQILPELNHTRQGKSTRTNNVVVDKL
jgi:hypothetical protein